ncbi:MAG: acetate--CoA ligase family protein [Methanomassiliicoccales archaeon]
MVRELFEPDSIAIIGASREEKKVGHIVLRNLISSGFAGALYPINPQAKEILGIKCYPSVLEVPGRIDLGLVCVPNILVPDVMEQMGNKGVKAAIVISAGFKETGKEGAELERRTDSIAKAYGIRVLGPNCLGLINTQRRMNATFTNNYPREGSIGISSQSGAICSVLLDWASRTKAGFSKFVSLGNKMDIEEADVLRYLRDDPKTKVIGMYIEGITRGADFMQQAEATSKVKPVIALKAGRTSSGAKAASSHTGAISSGDKVYQAALEQSGVIRAHDIEELFDLLMIFSSARMPRTEGGVAIVTNAGGLGVMAADACGDHDLALATFSHETVERLRSYLPAEANVYNPVDVIGDATADRYDFAIRTVMQDPAVSSVLVLLAPTDLVDIPSVARIVASHGKSSAMPVVACFAGGNDVHEGLEILRQAGIPDFESPDRAVRALSAMVEYQKARSRNVSETFPTFEGDKERVRALLAKVKSQGRVGLSESEGKEILRAYGISVPDEGMARTEEEAVELARRIGYPIVLKVESPDIAHKTDVGGVVVGLRREEEVRHEFNLLLSRVRAMAPRARVEGVLVQRMISGREVIVGMVRDDQFGPVVTFGLGGIFVEVLKDVAQRIVPLSNADVTDLIRSIRAYPILTGVRGRKPADLEALRQVILKVAQVAQDFPEITELEINPLIVGDVGEGAGAVDALVTIRRESA